MGVKKEHIKWFRDSSPYIDAHWDKTFVVCPDGDALDAEQMQNIMSDIALLNSLGIRLVLVFGARPQIDRALTRLDYKWQEVDGIRVTSPDMIKIIAGTVGSIQAMLEAELSKGVPNSPVKGRETKTASGNYIKAQPLGTIEGTDYQNTGVVRRVHQEAIRAQLEQRSIVLIGPLGYSPSGEIFNLSARRLACDVAAALRADKLIYLTRENGIRDHANCLISEIDLSKTERHVAAAQQQKLLEYCSDACNRGVQRCHIIGYETDGALLEELFTRDGCGTQVIRHSYEQIRRVQADDVGGILKLIEPLEESGVLVKRSRELLESEIDRFIVIERDGLLIGCAALYQYDKQGELACLVTHPEYRNGDRGDRLLAAVEKIARDNSLLSLFVLTTQSAHWFIERGFGEVEINSLPKQKQTFYNNQRGSKVFVKQL